MRVLPEIARALDERRPVVALESSVLAQGLPAPQNAEAARRMTEAVLRAGATPAITAVVRGTPTLGLTPEELERFLAREGVRKVSARDIPAAMASGFDGATTVAASLLLAALGGIRVFATGGIGGVHRGVHRGAGDPAVERDGAPSTYDESADLVELSRTSVVVVCAGAKSILDLRATWERLETLGVSVTGYRTSELPGFYTAKTGIELTDRVEDVEEIARRFEAQRQLGRAQALLVVQPPPAEYALDDSRVERAVQEAMRSAERDGVRGAAMTPFLLERVTRLTEGRSLDANLALLEKNASLAGEIAVALSPSRKGRNVVGR